MTKEEKLAEKCFIKLFNDEPVKIIQMSLLLFGTHMVEANAETMKLKQQSDIEGDRYEITINAKVKKVKSVVLTP